MAAHVSVSIEGVEPDSEGKTCARAFCPLATAGMAAAAPSTTAPYQVERLNYRNDRIESLWSDFEPKIFDLLLHRVIESDEKRESMVSAAQALNALYLELLTRGFAAKLPCGAVYQDRLVEFLKALQSLPDPVNTDLGDWGTFKIWEGLPLLAPVSRENWNSYDFLSEEGCNIGGFVGRLTREGIADFAWMGLWGFYRALETKPSRGSKRLKKQGAEADAYAPTTLIWLRLAGRKLYEEALAGSLS
ncbi:hypothetical protein NMY22_g5463 [Coprinellus aureogranulatus]|nr:hypothetical protein NMY22_g5463 [Coprinellus aureogranulatus]